MWEYIATSMQLAVYTAIWKHDLSSSTVLVIHMCEQKDDIKAPAVVYVHHPKGCMLHTISP